MHTAISAYIIQAVQDAGTFVTSYLDTGLTADDIYEAMIGNEDMLAAFHKAAQYVQPTRLGTTLRLGINGRPMWVSLNLGPTVKWPVRLLPTAIITHQITPESKVGRALELSLQVAEGWSELTVVTQIILTNMALTVAQEVHLLPWIRDLAVTCPFHDNEQRFMHLFGGDKATKRDFNQVRRDLAKIVNAETPTNFPTRSKLLTAACRSGNALFGQYRILDSSISDARRRYVSPICIGANETLVRPELKEALQEMKREWVGTEW